MGLCAWSVDAKLLLLCPRPDGSCLVPAAFSRVYQLPNEKNLGGGGAEETRVDAGSPQWREPRTLGHLVPGENGAPIAMGETQI